MVLWSLGILLLLVLTLFIFLQTPAGKRVVLQTLVRTVNTNILADGSLEVDRLQGNLVRDLHLSGIRIRQSDGALLQLDSLSASYRLLPLLSRRVHLLDVHLSHPQISLRRRSDSLWNTSALLPPGSDSSTEPSPWEIVLDTLLLEDGWMTAATRPASDSTDWTAEVPRLLLSSIRYGGGSLGGQIDTLFGHLAYIERPDSVAFALVGGLSPTEFRLDTLLLDSDLSRVTGSGIIPFSLASADSSSFSLDIERLAFLDLQAVAPTLDPDGSVHGALRVMSGPNGLRSEGLLAGGNQMRIAHDLAILPDSTGPSRFTLTASVERLDPAYLTGNATLRGSFNIDLSADITGSDPESYVGRARMEVLPSVWRGRALSRSEITMQVADGQVQTDWTLRLAGGHLDGAASFTPWAPETSYELEGGIHDIDLEGLTHALAMTPREGRLEGSYRFSGLGLEPATAQVSGLVDLTNSTVGNCLLERAETNIQLSDGGLDGSLSLGYASRDSLLLPASELDLAFVATYEGQDWNYRTTRGSFSSLDFSCFQTEEPRYADLTGQFSVSGRGLALETANVNSRLVIRESSLAGLQVDSLLLTSRYADSRLRAQVFVERDSGIVDLGLELDMRRGTSFSFDGSASRLNIASLFPGTEQQTDLTAGFSGRASFASGQLSSGSYELRIQPSTVRDQVISGGQLSGDVVRGLIGINGTLDLSDGGLDVTGSIALRDEETRLAIDSLSFRRLDVGRITSTDSLRTQLSGGLSGEVRIADSGAMQGALDVRIDPSEVNGRRLTGGTISISLQDSIIMAETEIAAETGSISATGRLVRQSGSSVFELDGLLSDVDAAGIAGLDSLAGRVNARWNVQGRLSPSDAMRMSGLVRVYDSILGGIQIDSLTVRADYANEVLDIQQFVVASNVTDLSGSGTIAIGRAAPAQSDFRMNGTIHTLEPLSAVANVERLGGNGTFTATTSGVGERLRFVLTPSLDYVWFNNYRISDVEIRIAGQRRPALTVEIDVQTGFVSNPTLSFERIDLEFLHTGDSLRYQASVEIDSRRGLSTSGLVRELSGNRQAQVNRLNIRLGPDTLALAQPATIELVAPYRIRNFLLTASDQQIALDGMVNPDGRQNFVFTADNFRAGAVADLLGFPGLEARLDAFLALTGPASSPQMSGQLDLTEIVSQGRHVGALRSEIAYEEGRMDISATLRSVDDRTMTLSGFVPFSMSLAGLEAPADDEPADLDIEAEAFPIGWLEPFIDPRLVTSLEGLLTASIDVSGTQGRPSLSGDLSLTNGSITVTNASIPYHSIQIEATLEGSRLVLSRAEATSGDGRLRATGSLNFVTLSEQEYDIDVSLSDFRAIETDTYRATVGGDLQLAGSSLRPELTGSLRLGPADIYMTEELTAEEFESVSLTPEDLQVLEARFGYRITRADTSTFNFNEALSMVLEIEMERDVWLRSAKDPEMDIEFTGSLRAEKEPYEDQSLFGTITVNTARSSISQYGRKFTVESGTLRFNGPFEETLVDIRAAYQVPRRKGNPGPEIFLDISGRLEQIQLEVSSEPTMESIDVLSYIATGRPAGESLFGGGGGGSSIEGRATQLAVGQLSSMVEGIAGDELGLDVIEIESDGLRGATLTVGKYVLIGGRHVFVSLQQPINLSSGTETSSITSNTEAVVELQLLKTVLLRLASRNRSLRFNLLYEYAY